MRVALFSVLLLALASGCATKPDNATGDDQAAARRFALIARGDSLALPGEWTPPPGEALWHQTAGFAKTMCSNIFYAGLDPADAAENLGGFTSPFSQRQFVTDTVVDREKKEVRLTLPDGTVRVARVFKGQGCVALPIGVDSVYFTPTDIQPKLPDAATLALVVTHNGRIIGERYAPGIGIHTPLESWSMGKSLTGTLVARLIQLGNYTLEQPAPFPEWQTAGDPRQKIRIMDIMRMSSGLRIRAPQDPDWNDSLGYPDHVYLYTGTVDSYKYAATRPQQWEPNTVGRYRNVDPVLASYLVRLGAEQRGADYHSFPQRVLFDKIGIRDAIIDTDPYGNLLGQGSEMVAARDWARLANLYLQDGVWNGERLLPEGYVEHVSTVAPAWHADGRDVYGGGFFWVNADGGTPIPRTAYSMQGAGGQSATIIPTHGLVVVRIGKYRMARAGGAALDRGFELFMDAVKPKR